MDVVLRNQSRKDRHKSKRDRHKYTQKRKKDRHTDRVDSAKIEDLSCKYCNKKFRYLKAFKNHVAYHFSLHGRKVPSIQCKYCDKLFVYAEDYFKHKAKHEDFSNIRLRWFENSASITQMFKKTKNAVIFCDAN